jgi:adenosylmethionine-8-amino-7-oxononanoate aminotransferase
MNVLRLKSSQTFFHSLSFYYHGQTFGTISVRGKIDAVIFFITVIEPKNESLNDSMKLSLAKKTTKKWACLWQKALLCPLFGRFFS